jgi:MFS family permease
VSPRTVLGPYVRLFAVPGAASFSLAGWLGRLPASTAGLGTVLLVSAQTGSYALAGGVSGTLALAFAAASPVWARAADRRGQGRVLRLSMGTFLVSGLAFVAVVLAGAPVWTWFALAVVAGAAAPSIGSMVRTRWSHALADPGQRQTAFAFESVVDEVVFVVAPPVATVLAALVAPPAGFLAGLVAGVAGGLWLSRQRSTEPPASPRQAGSAQGRWVALSAAVVVVTVSSVAVGTVFGAMDVVVVAFAREQGAPAVAGGALAAYAAGSLVAGLVYGLARLPGTLTSRFLACSAAFAVAAQVLLAVGSLPALVPAVFLAGLTIAPVLVSGMTLVESAVPRAALTEALTWTTTGLTVGVTAGSALAGAAVDAAGARPAFAVPCAAAVLAALLALAGARWLPRRGGPPGGPAFPAGHAGGEAVPRPAGIAGAGPAAADAARGAGREAP